jgi:putative PIN family toxin of toxin-antitoxin system
MASTFPEGMATVSGPVLADLVHGFLPAGRPEVDMMSYDGHSDVMRVVVDTNVLVEGLSRKGTCGRVVDAWVDRKFVPCVSTALAFEYEAVLRRHGSSEKVEDRCRAMQALLARAEFVPVVFSYRPSSPDPSDDFVIDCVMNARAGLVTSNIRHFERASAALGFALWKPTALLAELGEE